MTNTPRLITRGYGRVLSDVEVGTLDVPALHRFCLLPPSTLIPKINPLEFYLIGLRDPSRITVVSVVIVTFSLRPLCLALPDVSLFLVSTDRNDYLLPRWPMSTEDLYLSRSKRGAQNSRRIGTTVESKSGDVKTRGFDSLWCKHTHRNKQINSVSEWY